MDPVLIAFLFVASIIMSFGVATVLWDDKVVKLRKRLEAEAEKREGERAREYLASRQALDEEKRLAIAQAVLELREVAEGRYRSDLPIADPGLLDRQLKEAARITSHRGRVLTVRVLLYRSGFVGFEWMLDLSRPQPLRVVCTQNGLPVFGGHYEYRGVFVLALNLGAEYCFRFSAFEGKKDWEEDFHFVVQVPTDAHWDSGEPTGLVDDAAEREQRIKKRIESIAAVEQFWDAARREGDERIDASGGTDTDAERKQKKARFHAKLIDERDRVEREDG